MHLEKTFLNAFVEKCKTLRKAGETFPKVRNFYCLSPATTCLHYGYGIQLVFRASGHMDNGFSTAVGRNAVIKQKREYEGWGWSEGVVLSSKWEHGLYMTSGALASRRRWHIDQCFPPLLLPTSISLSLSLPPFLPPFAPFNTMLIFFKNYFHPSNPFINSNSLFLEKNLFTLANNNYDKA